MNETPRTDEAERANSSMLFERFNRVPADFARRLEQELTTAQAQLKEFNEKYVHQDLLLDEQDKLAAANALAAGLREEIEFLRSWGNKDCTRMADQALAEHRAALTKADAGSTAQPEGRG